MKSKPLDLLRTLADVERAEPRALTRRERLERWAELLERAPARRLKSLEEIELTPRAERSAMRADNSPISVAHTDPVLRVEGLAGDTLGDAMGFFGLSQGQAHRVLCSCMNGVQMEAGSAAQRIRIIARGDLVRRGTIALTAGVLAGLTVLACFVG